MKRPVRTADVYESLGDDDGDDDLPGGLERVECVECGHGVVTNKPDDVDRCAGCRGSDE